MQDATQRPIETAAAGVAGEAPVLAAPLPAPEPAWKLLGRRLLYWTPVIVPMVLFAQVALFGLRPALREQERLATAEVELRARHARDTELALEVQAHLRARTDPVFVERQRRLRELPRDALSKRP